MATSQSNDGAAPARSPVAPMRSVGGFVFVSGQASTNASSGEFLPGTFDEEFARTMANVRAVLATAGATLMDVVRVGAYLRDETDRQRFNELYAREFSPPFPARTTTGNTFQFLRIEMDCVAYIGGR